MDVSCTELVVVVEIPGVAEATASVGGNAATGTPEPREFMRIGCAGRAACVVSVVSG